MLSQGNRSVSTSRLAEGVAGVLEIEQRSQQIPRSLSFPPLGSVLPAVQSSSRKVVYPYYGGSAYPGLLLTVNP